MHAFGQFDRVVCMSLLERYLTVWVALGIAVGVYFGWWMPGVFQTVASLDIAHVNLIMAILIWAMIYPMMIQIDWLAVKDVGKVPRGLLLTLVINWLIKPFTMAALGVLVEVPVMLSLVAIINARRPPAA